MTFPTSGEDDWPMDEDNPDIAARRELGNRSPILDDFKVESHPRAQKPTQYFTYENYTTSNPSVNPSVPQQHSNAQGKPWAPFVKRLDFEVAEFMKQAGLNRKQMNSLLSLITDIRQQPKEFTLVDAKHVREMWKIAAEHCNVGVRPPCISPIVCCT